MVLLLIAFFFNFDTKHRIWVLFRKVQVGKDQEKVQSEKDSHSKNRGGKKPNQQSCTYTMKHIVSRMSSYFPNRWPLSYLNPTKNMKTHIRRQQHKKNFKHQDIKRKEPPQKYRLGTISNTKLLAGLNRFYMAITSPLGCGGSSVYPLCMYLSKPIKNIKFCPMKFSNFPSEKNICILLGQVFVMSPLCLL